MTSKDGSKTEDDAVNVVVDTKDVVPENDRHVPLLVEQPASGTVKPVSFCGLFRYATCFDYFLLLIGVFSALGFGVCLPLTILFTGDLFDAYGMTSVSQASRTSMFFIYIGIAVLFLASLQMICFSLLAARLTARAQIAFFRAVLKHDVTYYDLHGSSAGLAAMASSNMELFKAAIGQKLGMAIQATSVIITAVVIGFFYAWELSLVVVAFMPSLGLGAYLFGSQSAKFAKEQLEAYLVAGSVIDEALGSIRTVTALSLQDHFSAKLSESLRLVTKKGRRAGLCIGLGIGLMLLSYQVSFAPSYYVGAVLVVNDRKAAFDAFPDVCNCALCLCGCYYPAGRFDSTRCIAGGGILLVFFCVIVAGFGLGQFLPNVQSVNLGKIAASRLFEIIDSTDQEEVARNGGQIVAKEDVRGELVFENAVFAYPSRTDALVLNGTNLVIPAGKRIAICGQSGSGKSSIVSLVMRFYDLRSGRLLLDGVDVKDLDTQTYRASIGLVSQEPVLFAGVSIRENVRFGKPGATDEEVEEACRMANAHDFVASFPDKYDTILVGSSLSGGQKQRIAIARALIRDPRILILDEASAALDSESERLVNEAIDKVVENTKRTVIVVAHRLSTIRTCESIVMMGPGGRILEQGSHEELMALKGPYYHMNMAGEKTDKGSRRRSSARKSGTAKRVSGGPFNEDGKVEIVLDSGIEGKVESTKRPKRKGVPLRRVFRFSYPERCYYFPALLACAASGAVDPLLALTFSRIVPALYYMNNSEVISSAALYAFIFLGLGCMKGLVTVISTWAFGIITAEMTTRVRVATFSHLLRMEMAFFDEPEHNVGAMSQKLSKDAAMVKASIGDYSAVMVMVMSGLAVGLVIAFLATWKLTLVVFALFPLMGLSFGVDMYFRGGGLDRAAKAESAAAQTFGEAINGFRTVCAFNLRETLVDLYHEQLDEGLPIEKRAGTIQGMAFGFAQSILFFSLAVMFYYATVLLNDGEIDFQDMLQSIMAIVFTAINVGNAVGLSPDVAKGQSAVRSIFSVLDRKSKIDPADPAGLQPSTVMGDVTLAGVSFAYPSRKDFQVLKNFNFELKRGSIVALVGESGSGKSTIVQLLERFYDADAGRVLLDGNPLNDLNVAWLRSRIGLVSQEPVLFDETIFSNIKHGLGLKAQGKTDSEIAALVETAAKDANAYDFIVKLPEGFNTMCGQKGGQLSGGQKQRIAIARALVRDPEILLCDEATSALDEESQRTVQDALDRLIEAKNRTVIIIAHRLTTIQRADSILVLRKGEVVETGTYHELASKEGGYFRALLAAQGGSEE